jgi:hypothetical protein
MCKFESETASGFDIAVDAIQRYAEDSPPVIKARWTAEKEERLTRAVRKAKEIYPDAIGMYSPKALYSISDSPREPETT